MLSNILASTHHHVREASDAIQDQLNRIMDPQPSELNDGDSAQWAAGLLYAYSGQETDVRNYLVGCSVQNDNLDQKLWNAYYRYSNGEWENGNRRIMNSERFFRVSMRDCPETNDSFDELSDKAHAFFGQEGW